MKFLYPCDPFNKKSPEENYLPEFEAISNNGFKCLLYSEEDFEFEPLKTRPSLQADDVLVYRGWMLSKEKYTKLFDVTSSVGAKMLVNPTQYLNTHYISNWYESCKELTPDTHLVPEGNDYKEKLLQKNWAKYFVKDFVKSLTTARGSVANNLAEIDDILTQIKHYRGQLEGGICIREYEEFLVDTEERYFVFQGQVFSRNEVIPSIVNDIATRIDSPFFSVDIVQNSAGKHRLIELGDGQVSDTKKWSTQSFASIFKD